MELNINANNVDVNKQLRAHIERKFGGLIRHLPAISSVPVELSSQPTRSQDDRMTVQVTMNVGGSLLRAEQRAANAIEAVNLAAGVLDRRIERYKSRTYRSERAQAGRPAGGPTGRGRFPSPGLRRKRSIKRWQSGKSQTISDEPHDGGGSSLSDATSGP